ncbi:MAG: Na+/H+ antiporter [Chloroflexota bacterium]
MEHGIASTSVSTLVWLLATVILVAVASKYIRIPYTIALTIAGLLIAISDINLKIDLTPDIILFIFLPALLFESSYNLRFAEVRDNVRPIVLLAVPGVLLTAVCVAAGLHYTTGVGWDTAFLFGAIMSATDPVSVLAIFRKIGAPRRLSVILEGESLFNDGTSIVVFRIVLAVVIAHTVGNVVVTIEQFLVVVLGAVALGLVVGFVVSALLSRVNDYLIETSLTLIVAYGTYLLAEEALGVSGVIAVVVAALVLGNYGRVAAMSPTTRLAVSSTWEFFGFLANSLIFLLIGLELDIEKLAQYWPATLVAIGIVLLVRAVVVAAASWVLYHIHRPIPARWQAVLVWGGLRGSLALALALSIPLTIGVGELFPDRDLILVMTFGVILFSLLVQGLSMEPLLSKLGLIDRRDQQDEYETLSTRKGMVAAALNEIERMSKVGALTPRMAAELKGQYTGELNEVDENLRDLHLRDEDLSRAHERRVKRRLLLIVKNVVRQRNLDGAISEEPMRKLLAELDEEMHTLDEED